MRVLVIGSGGREHALVWKLAQSNLCEKVFVAPGNAGTADEPKTENVDLSAEDLDGLLDFAKNKEIEKQSLFSDNTGELTYFRLFLNIF